ncbi:head maturation protease, ClpP-related [uncultured Veillonella sp.]|uniref:head maturation protease, ClpP-related n=1 Tax=uncultured Veillonella sp. TaxID=159268 RepID=UPI002593B596|nr:head maturation protease, ClpP-related [uncultured Veillonella sp.]
MNKKFWSFTNSIGQNGTEQSELMLYGDISQRSWWGDEITPKQFADDLARCGTNDLTVRINSGGGDVFAAQSIYNMLKSYAGQVTVMIDGICASAATIVACAGDKVVMPSNALYMIHNPSVCLLDSYDADELEKITNYLSSVKQTIVNVYLQRNVNVAEDELKQFMDNETWLTADEAKSYGFIDEIGGDVAEQAVMNKGLLVVNKVSCKYAAKNAAKIEQVINQKGAEPMPEQNEKTVLNKIAELLGIDTQASAAVPSANDAVAVERERIAALDAMKNGNEAVNRIIEVAKANGQAVNDVKPFVDSLQDMPEPQNKALEAITQLIQDNVQSGAQNVGAVATPAADDVDVQRKKELDEVVNFANSMRGAN